MYFSHAKRGYAIKTNFTFFQLLLKDIEWVNLDIYYTTPGNELNETLYNFKFFPIH